MEQVNRTSSAPALATTAAFALLRKPERAWTHQDLENSELTQRVLTHPEYSTKGSRQTAERLKSLHKRAAHILLEAEGATRLAPRRMRRPLLAKRLICRALRGVC